MTQTEADSFIADLPLAWQRALCVPLLDCIRAAGPELQMSIKWKNPYFEHHGAVLKLFFAKKWVNVYFFHGNELADPHKLFIDTSNVAMRTVRVHDNDALPTDALADLVRRAVRLNARG